MTDKSTRLTIRLVGLAGHAEEGTEFDGQYLVEYDPSRQGVSPSGQPMLCHLVTTPNRGEARQFSAAEALTTWQLQDGYRPDGRPNRPLTAFHVMFETVE